MSVAILGCLRVNGPLEMGISDGSWESDAGRISHIHTFTGF